MDSTSINPLQFGRPLAAGYLRGVRAVDRPPASRVASPEPAQWASRLIAGRVHGIDFTPQPRMDAFTLYTRPADCNAAATGVMAGRVMDVTG